MFTTFIIMIFLSYVLHFVFVSDTFFLSLTTQSPPSISFVIWQESQTREDLSAPRDGLIGVADAAVESKRNRSI